MRDLPPARRIWLGWELWPAAGFVDTEIGCFMRPEGSHAETEVQSEFEVEAVRLVRERGVSAAQVARDLDVHENVLRKWVKEFAASSVGAYPDMVR